MGPNGPSTVLVDYWELGFVWAPLCGNLCHVNPVIGLAQICSQKSPPANEKRTWHHFSRAGSSAKIGTSCEDCSASE